MKAVVFAYHDIGCTGLRALAQAGYQIAAIFTHTDDAAENHFFASVARTAAQLGVPVYAPEDVNHPLWIDRIRSMAPDVIFSFHYRHMLNDAIISSASRGAFNLHASLLPKYRGRAPLNWVLANGERETGVTLHHMVKRADAGAIIAQSKVPIADHDDALTLHHKMCAAAGELLANTLPDIRTGSDVAHPQDESQASYVGRRTPEDGRIDWQLPAQRIHNLVRAVTDPWPGAFSFVGSGKFIVWQSKVRHDYPANRPGTILSVAPWWWPVPRVRWRSSTGRATAASICRAASWLRRLGWWLAHGCIISRRPCYNGVPVY